MTGEGMITLTEFKTVIERFEDNQKKIVEVMNFRFDQMDGRFDKVEGRLDRVEGRLDRVEGRLGRVESRLDRVESRLDKVEAKSDSMMEQIVLLHEGQTEIKAELRSGLKDRVTYAEFAKLEKRVVRLEKKAV